MIDIRDYNRLRDKGFFVRDALKLSQPAPAGDRAVGAVVAGTLVFMVALVITGAIDEHLDERDRIAASRATKQSATTIDRLERVVINCLNGRPINVSGVVFECRAGSLGVSL